MMLVAMPLIPALGSRGSKSGLQSEFKDGQDYIKKPVSKTNAKTKQKGLKIARQAVLTI